MHAMTRLAVAAPMLAALAFPASGCASFAYDGTDPDAIECAAYAKFLNAAGELKNGVPMPPTSTSQRMEVYFTAQAKALLPDTDEAIDSRIVERAVAMIDESAEDGWVRRVGEPCVSHMLAGGDL